jgi:hypothetical protein
MTTSYSNRLGSWIAVVALMSAFGIVACGDDDDNPTPSNSEAGASNEETGGKSSAAAGTENASGGEQADDDDDSDTGGKGGKATGGKGSGGSAGEGTPGQAGQTPVENTGGAAGSVEHPEGGTTSTGGSTSQAGAPNGEAGSGNEECVPDPDSACYDCPPSTTEQFLNHCTDATCVAYDNSSLSALGDDGELPDIP